MIAAGGNDTGRLPLRNQPIGMLFLTRLSADNGSAPDVQEYRSELMRTQSPPV